MDFLGERYRKLFTPHSMWEERIYRQNLHVSPLGGIRLACYIKDGVGVLTSKRILPHYNLVFVTRGSGLHRDENGVERPVNAGDAIIVFPGNEHWYGPAKGDSWDEFYLVFEGPVFDMWRNTGCIARDQPVISLHPMDFWRDRILQLIGGPAAANDDDHLRECIRLQELLADIQKASHVDMHNDIEWLERAKQAIDDTLDPKRAAEILGQSYEVFRKQFRKLSRISPGKYRTGVIMRKACQMLAVDGLLLKHIAEELGFCDEYHFSRQFSKTIGWAPSEYRARILRQSQVMNKLGNQAY